ncbi:hypothetical protein PsorP6_009606 [Peronosclerospora sorghi]|uniref:Uncharacterized protein n=1 Tax=Peronosclerospora sorghi TaxID=230839 RepID=A0ACC0VZM8_9STRA|nr:hypothetical protein PsorP6_009606 [Peronosclerospora sorghi]
MEKDENALEEFATSEDDNIRVRELEKALQVRESQLLELCGRRGAALATETLRGITISLFFVTLQRKFLKMLAFAKQGLAPVKLRRVSIKQLVIHLATTWKMVVKVRA